MRRKKFNWVLLLVILFISTGFAFIAIDLVARGVITVNRMAWDVHIAEAKVVAGSVSSDDPVITGDKNDTAVFSANFYFPGDYYDFDMVIENAGTFDAKLSSFSSPTITTAQSKYLEKSITYSDGTAIKTNDELKIGERKTVHVHIGYKDDISLSDLPSEPVINPSYSISFSYTKK